MIISFFLFSTARCIRIGFWLPPCIVLVWLRLVKPFPWIMTTTLGLWKKLGSEGKAQPCVAHPHFYVPENCFGPKDPREKIVSTLSWELQPRESINYRKQMQNTSGFHLTCINNSARVSVLCSTLAAAFFPPTGKSLSSKPTSKLRLKSCWSVFQE